MINVRGKYMQPENYNEQLNYYKDNYDQVSVVTCNKCGAPIAFEVRGGVSNAGNRMHPDGAEVIPVKYSKHPQGMALAAWRPRLDGNIGYQCIAQIPNPDYEKAKAENEKENARLAKEHKAAYAKNDELVKEAQTALNKYAKEMEKFNKAKTNDAAPPEPPIVPALVAEDPPTVPFTEPEFIYCLNDTRVAESERYKVPVNNGGVSAPTMLPFERDQVRRDIKASGKKADVEVNGKTKRVETFKIERVK